MKKVMKSVLFVILLVCGTVSAADELVEVINIASWSVYEDSLGSTGTITHDTTAPSLKFEFSKEVVTDSTSPYVNSNGWLDSVFTGVTKVELAYSADKDFNLSLPMASTGDGSAHLVTLPASADTSVSFLIADFKQPVWVKVEDKKSLNLDSVQNLAFELTYVDDKAISGTITLSSIKLYDYSYDTTTVVDPVIVDTPDDLTGETSPVASIKKISWYEVKDDKGSAVTIDVDGTSGAVTSALTQAASSEGATYASLGGALDSTFTGITAISITYKCDSAVRFALPMTETADKGVTHGIVLPASADFTTFGKKINGFKQPSWTVKADSVTIDIDKINSIDFSIASYVTSEKVANLEISEIVLYGYKDTIVIPDTVETDTSDVLTDTANAVNVLPKASWFSVKDTLGSTVTFDVDDVNGAVNCDITKAAKSGDNYSFASLSGYFDSSFTGMTAMSLSYTSDKPVTVSLGMDETSTSGAAHSVTLPATGTKTVFNKVMTNFTQPDWTTKEDSVTLDLSKVQTLNFEIATVDSAEVSGSFSLTGLTFYNYLDTAIIDTNTYDTTLSDTAGVDSKWFIYWGSYADTLGSKVDTAATADGITFSVERAAAVDGSYPYASIIGFNGAYLEELAAVYLKYSATADFRFSLLMEETSVKGTTHGFVIPKTDGRAESVIMKTIGVFKQPSWVKEADKVDLKVSQVDRIQFEISDDDTKVAKSGELTINSLRYYGVVGVDVLKTENQIIPETYSITSNRLKLAVPSAGVYGVKLYSLNGKVLKSFDISLKRGMNTIGWANESLGEQIVLLNISGKNFKAIEKLVVQ